METKQLKAAVIGLGVGEQHIIGYGLANVEVVAICDLDSNKLKDVSQRFPTCEITTSADTVIENPAIDIVSIASYDNHHARQVLLSLKSGKHVFVEKPLCMNEQELLLIFNELARNPHLRLSTNTVLRISSRFIDVRSRLNAGDLGELFYVEADYNYGRLHKIREGWRANIPAYSVTLGGGIHVVDLLQWILGSHVTEVFSIGNKFCSGPGGFTGPDMVVSSLKFANGVIGKVSANFGCVYPHFHKVSLYGSKATFENKLEGGFLYTTRDLAGKPVQLSSPYPGLSKSDLIPSFVAAIRREGRAIVSERDAFNATATCLAIDKSIKSGQVEKVLNYDAINCKYLSGISYAKH